MHLLGDVTRQKTEFFACLHSGPREDNTADFGTLERGNRHRHGEVSFPCPSRSDAENQVIVLNRIDIPVLAGGFRTNDTPF